MPDDTTYNGWKNKETWLVNLWLGDALSADHEEGINVTADYIEEVVDLIFDETIGELNAGFIMDLLNCAKGEINYEKLASHYPEHEFCPVCGEMGYSDPDECSFCQNESGDGDDEVTI